MKYFIQTLILFFCTTAFMFSQEHEVKYLTTISTEKELNKLYDSLQIPLLIYNNKVFTINSECFSRNAGGNSNERNAGGNSSERNAGGNSSERNAGGNSSERKAGEALSYFSCGNDANGTLIIYFHNMMIDKTIKIYYNNSIFTSKNNFFKLKKL